MAYRKAPLIVPEGGTGQVTLTSHGVLVGNGTGTVSQTAAATTGQVLTGVTSSDPVWGNAGWVLIQTQPVGTGATLSFTTGITSTYDCYVFVFKNVVPATAANILQFQVSTNSGVSYVNSGYLSGVNAATYNSATIASFNSSTAFLVSGSAGNTASFGVNGTVFLTGVTSGQDCLISGNPEYSQGGNPRPAMVTGSVTSTSINAFQFSWSAASNFSTGNISLYGVRQ